MLTLWRFLINGIVVVAWTERKSDLIQFHWMRLVTRLAASKVDIAPADKWRDLH